VELERLVGERTGELERANRQLRQEIAGRERAQAALLQAQKIEALGQLVGGVAHDFNNLLMAVIGNLDLLSNAQATDVRSLVEDMMGLIERSVGPMVRVEIQAKGTVPAVDVDPNQLEMALLNLAVNARDAMVSGGVLTIMLTVQFVEVDDQLGIQPGRYVVISVRDTGEGMDAETLAKAVEPFFSTKGVGKGTGLGLSVVFGLAQQSGGALRLESAPSSGTTARLWLPIAKKAVRPSGRTPSVVIQASGRAKILFVDDDLLIAGSTVDLLEDLGHEVIEVHSAIEALRLLEDGLAADLLITDHAMPGMTGIELVREVRRQYPQLPILLATGFAELEVGNVVDVRNLTTRRN
jgi:signal transduction histidine kinase/CheY-like chemotaxis protein